MIRETKREQHKVVEYLKSWGKLGKVKLKDYDDSGTLSHILMLHLALFEDEMRATDGRLPEWKARKIPNLEETDAERQIAFTQEQRRRKVKEAHDQPLGIQGNEEDRSIGNRGRSGNEEEKAHHPRRREPPK